jgi:hypothetical protein
MVGGLTHIEFWGPIQGEEMMDVIYNQRFVELSLGPIALAWTGATDPVNRKCT